MEEEFIAKQLCVKSVELFLWNYRTSPKKAFVDQLHDSQLRLNHGLKVLSALKCFSITIDKESITQYLRCPSHFSIWYENRPVPPPSSSFVNFFMLSYFFYILIYATVDVLLRKDFDNFFNNK